jgi:isocitrate dehydrogenase kinase/phosphatase
MTPQISNAIAHSILRGFQRHYDLFIDITRGAKQRFEQADWQSVQSSARARIDYYDSRVKEAIADLRKSYPDNTLGAHHWPQVKEAFVQLLQDHPQPELAESFYNSVFCGMFSRRYYNNDNIFVEQSVARAPQRELSDFYTTYSPAEKGLKETLKEIILNLQFSLNFSQLERNVEQTIQAFFKYIEERNIKVEDVSIDIINSLFYRNKAAYLIGRVNTKKRQYPFILPILHNKDGGLSVDTLVLSKKLMSNIFGFSRAYFMVDTNNPCGIVSFISSLLSHKTEAELYNSLGFHKQGKTEFYRDLLHHLEQTPDQFIIAPGVKGMVMAVFTLPSFPYVFKIIKDRFAPQKTMTPKIVREKYRLVKLHDRVGRMADTMEYSHVAIPKNRVSEELMQELHDVAASSIRFEDDLLIIKHLYIERRMVPLNLYLNYANPEEIEAAIIDYGLAIKQMIAADIFPGDMLLKNFGVTRQKRIVFYDYDEVSYLHEINFREIPEPLYPEQEMSGEPWYNVAPNDVFPEELATFIFSNHQYRKLFIKHHGDLLTASYWRKRQANIQSGIFEDVFPYPEAMRFDH